MKIPVRQIQATQKRPFVAKGYHMATLKEIKDLGEDKRYGHTTAAFLWEIAGDKQILAQRMTTFYKQEDGELKSAIGKKKDGGYTKLADLLMKLGWEYSDNGDVELDQFLGVQVEVLVKEYEYDYTDPDSGKTEKAKASFVDEVPDGVKKK